MNPSPVRRRALGLAAAGALLLGAAACGDDADDGDLAAYCDAEVAIEQQFADVDFEDPEAIRTAAADALADYEQVVELSPEEVAEQNQVFVDTVAEIAETGDPSGFEREAVAEASEAVHAFDLEHCDWNVVELTAEDYRFDGDLPTGAGPTSFELTNAGEEPHVLVVARKLDAVEGSALEAFESVESEEDFPASFEEVSGAFAEPGASGHGIVDLPAGEYVVFCPIPVGTTAEGEGDGPPHFTQGMVAAFEVG